MRMLGSDQNGQGSQSGLFAVGVLLFLKREASMALIALNTADLDGLARIRPINLASPLCAKRPLPWTRPVLQTVNGAIAQE